MFPWERNGKIVPESKLTVYDVSTLTASSVSRSSKPPGKKGKLVELPRTDSVGGPGCLVNEKEFFEVLPEFSR